MSTLAILDWAEADTAAPISATSATTINKRKNFIAEKESIFHKKYQQKLNRIKDYELNPTG